MLTHQQGLIAVQSINTATPLAGKRKRESLSSATATATASLTDLSHTPQPKRICSQGSVSTASSTVVPEEPENNSQPTMRISSDVQQNITGIVELAAPSDKDTKDVAKHVANKISSMVDGLSRCKTRGTIANRIRQMAGRLGISSSTGISYETTDNMAKDVLKFAPWIKAPLVEGKTELLPMYEFAHFVYFVTECISLLAPDDCKPDRMVVPLQPTTSEYQNCGEESGLFGAKLEYCRPGTNWRSRIDLEGKRDLIRPHHRHRFIGAAMVADSLFFVSQAYKDMGKYTEYLYRRQNYRSFIWGLAVVDSLVHSTLFGPNFTLSSASMDVRTKAGRDQFIQLLVNWAYCDEYKLGHDSSMTVNKDRRCWEIPVDDIDEENGTASRKTYYGYEHYKGASGLRGRHTKCIVFKDTLPEERFHPDYTDGDNMLLKDVWPEATAGNLRDEVKHLRNITKGLACKEELEGMYPELLGGGCVQVDGRDETTRSFLGEHIWGQLKDTPLCVHRRMVTKGFGEQLCNVRSIPELVVVLADAMEIHAEIYKTCGIYHRDISTGNILIRRDKKTGKAKGMLIDFDAAIRVDDVPKDKNERVGTLPFLSIGRLEELECPCTVLDDWESLLYLVCWLGLFSIDDDYQPDDSSKLPYIDDWQRGCYELIGGSKRGDLSSTPFRKLLGDFDSEQPHCNLLCSMAIHIWQALFYNQEVNRKGRGYKTGTQYVKNVKYHIKSDYMPYGLKKLYDLSEYNHQDPFKSRTNAEDVKEISGDLMKVMKTYKDISLKLLEKEKQEGNSV